MTAAFILARKFIFRTLIYKIGTIMNLKMTTEIGSDPFSRFAEHYCELRDETQRSQLFNASKLISQLAAFFVFYCFSIFSKRMVQKMYQDPENWYAILVTIHI